MGTIRGNSQIISVLCDYSGNHEHNVVGLATCIVGSGHFYKASKYKKLATHENVHTGEYMALQYGIETLINVLPYYEALSFKPSYAILYSDIDHIKTALYNGGVRNDQTNRLIEEILHSIKNTTTLFPWIQIKVKYIGRRIGLDSYYKLTHQNARREVRQFMDSRTLGSTV